jgi:ubiquitin-conjugating enzyme E2 Z
MTTSTVVMRVQKDLKDVQQSYGLESEGPLMLASTVDDQIDHVYALIMGPPDSPYHDGFFIFEIRFPPTYPNVPPKVKLLNTDSGRLRFNPNLYSDGKVCLSILGTWRGESGGSENWRPSYSLGYVLQCIQCVIMNGEPFYNEPGFEKDNLRRCAHAFGVASAAPTAPAPEPSNSPSLGDDDKEDNQPTPAAPQLFQMPKLSDAEHDALRKKVDGASAAYTMKLRHEVLRHAVCDTLESLLELSPPQRPRRYVDGQPAPAAADDAPEPKMSAQPVLPAFALFASDVKQQFLMRVELYKAAVVAQRQQEAAEAGAAPVALHDGTAFSNTPFEPPSNQCAGRYHYAWLLERLDNIQRALAAETESWRLQGAALTARMSYSASLLKDDADTLHAVVAGVSGGPVSPSNVYHWRLTFFVSEGLFEDSAYVVELDLHEESSVAPRVRFTQPIFHPNVSAGGVPHYFDQCSVPQHKQASPHFVAQRLRQMLVDPPCTRASAVLNPEAAALCFSRDPDDTKKYRRRARQMAQRTVE